MRPRPLSLAFATLLSILGPFAISCTVGQSNQGDDDGTGIDGGDDGSDGNTADCDPAVTEGLPAAHHNPGLACATAGCHAEPVGLNAPAYTAAGTVYVDVGGSAPVSGATVRLIDANDTEVVIVTASDGNFWTEQALVFPINAQASRCPDNVAMVSQITAGPVSCNASGCHGVMRLHVP
jgi:hypothetical protein